MCPGNTAADAEGSAAFRFLGLLHMEVFHQRLEQEYGAAVISTAPTVPFRIDFSDGTSLDIQNP